MPGKQVWTTAGGVAALLWAVGVPAPVRTEVADPFTVARFCVPPVSAPRPPITVRTGSELQQALDRAAAGDTIQLSAGATFRPAAREGSFMLRNRPIPAGQWVTLRSTSPDFDVEGSTPPERRVDPSAGPRMAAVLATSSNVAAIRAEPGAHGYRLIGLEIRVDDSVTQISNLIELGSDTARNADEQPYDIVIDRCYVHGSDSGNYRRGVAMNGKRIAVVDSYLSNFHDANGDSQALAGWNGPGPFKIVNNYLEAASENIMFGGSDPAIPDLVPSDIEVRRNLSTKRLSWRAAGVAAKNAFELKNARRVLVDGNTFEHVWPSGQDGTAIVLKSSNQEGRCPWCVTEYVTFTNNVVRRAAHGFILNAAETGKRGLPLPQPANHIRIRNSVFQEIGGAEWKGGKLMRVFGGVSDLEVTHITSTGNPAGILEPQNPRDQNPNLIFAFNIVERRLYGIGAGGDEGTKTLSRNFAPFVYKRNVLVNVSEGTDQALSDGALKSRYPADTLVTSGWKALGFAPGLFTLGPTSSFRGVADDNKDPGADAAALLAAQAGPGSAECPGRR